MRKLADLWDPYGEEGDKKVRCKVCAHYCVITPGKRGFCRTRENEAGKLYTLVYGSAIHGGSNDPIEKKPLYNFFPGSNIFSIATIGCNFHCKFCQNWDISQAFPDQNGTCSEFSKADQEFASPNPLVKLSPEDVIKRTLKVGSKSIAYTYNEPTIWFEFIRDTALLAKKSGLMNVLVTNGYSSLESNQEFVKFIDATNIDFKAFDDAFYQRLIGVPKLQPVLDTAKYCKTHGMHVEITNLIIPNENDNLNDIRRMVIWIKENLGKDTPLHFSAYYPRYKLQQPPTPPGILIKAWKLAREEGLYYVYMGNVRSDEGENTYCHQCHALLIERHGYTTIKRNINENSMICEKCGTKAFIIGQFIQDR